MRVFLNHIKVQLKEVNSLIYSIDYKKILKLNKVIYI